MNKKTAFVIVIIFIAFIGFWLINTNQKFNVFDIKYVRIAGQEIKVDLAITPAEQEQGLSGRSALAEDEGMLFVFNQPGKYLFWMKDMNFAIDMIWITEDMSVVYIKKNALPELYPETYGPDTPALYVLEVPAGFSDKHNLKVGDRVLFTY